MGGYVNTHPTGLWEQGSGATVTGSTGPTDYLRYLWAPASKTQRKGSWPSQSVERWVVWLEDIIEEELQLEGMRRCFPGEKDTTFPTFISWSASFILKGELERNCLNAQLVVFFVNNSPNNYNNLRLRFTRCWLWQQSSQWHYITHHITGSVGIRNLLSDGAQVSH